jgi:hypothetical protein
MKFAVVAYLDAWNPRFSPTLWPGHRVAEPSALAADIVAHAGDWLLLATPDVNVEPFVRLPNEVYLHELADADPGSDEDIRRVAALGWWRSECDVYSDLGVVDEADWRRTRTEVAAATGRPYVRDLEAARRDITRTTSRQSAMHLDEIALRLRLVQTLTRHLVAYQDGAPLREVWPRCTSEEYAWHIFETVTN